MAWSFSAAPPATCPPFSTAFISHTFTSGCSPVGPRGPAELNQSATPPCSALSAGTACLAQSTSVLRATYWLCRSSTWWSQFWSRACSCWRWLLGIVSRSRSASYLPSCIRCRTRRHSEHICWYFCGSALFSWWGSACRSGQIASGKGTDTWAVAAITARVLASEPPAASSAVPATSSDTISQCRHSTWGRPWPRGALKPCLERIDSSCPTDGHSSLAAGAPNNGSHHFRSAKEAAGLRAACNNESTVQKDL